MQHKLRTAFYLISALSLSMPVSLGYAAGTHEYKSNGSQLMQLAGDTTDRLEDKTAGKVNESEEMGSSATHAVERVHRRHELAERHHHTLRSKLHSKAHEVSSATEGAADAADDVHHQHELHENE